MADSTNAQIGATVDLYYWDTSVSPDAYTALGQIRSISGIGVDKPEVDSTTLDSTAVERIGGLPDGKQASIVFTSGVSNGNLDKIRGWVAGTSEVDLKLVIGAPATETLYFSIIPLGYDLGTIQPNNLIEVTLTGRITGDIVATDPHA
jgi:hypothetical protein